MAQPPVTPPTAPSAPTVLGVENARKYWRKTSCLMATTLAVWAFLSLGLPLFADSLNQVTVLGFPLGYYLVAQGALIGFAVLVFWYARQQNAIDEDFHVAED